MLIQLAGKERDLNRVEDLESVTSRSTRRELRRVRVVFTARGADLNESVVADLQSGSEDDAPLSDADGTRWKVATWSSHGWPDEEVEYTVELLEQEVVAPSRLVFSALDVAVERYAEDVDGDRFVTTSMFTANGEQSKVLERAIMDSREAVVADEDPAYFDLRRVGVDETPRRVRFGQTLWQRGEPGVKRWLVSFVEEEGDDFHEPPSPLSLFDEPRSTNVSLMTLQHHAMLLRLIGELEAAGVLRDGALNDYSKLEGTEHTMALFESRHLENYL